MYIAILHAGTWVPEFIELCVALHSGYESETQPSFVFPTVAFVFSTVEFGFCVRGIRDKGLRSNRI